MRKSSSARARFANYSPDVWWFIALVLLWLVFGRYRETPQPVPTVHAPQLTADQESVGQIAVDLVRKYYGLIENREYELAYSLLGKQWQANQTYARFEQGFANTDLSHLVAAELMYATLETAQVRATIEALEYQNTRWSRYEGVYIVQFENGGWRIISGQMQLVSRR